MKSGFHILDHPADIGIESWGASFSDALSEAVAGLASVLVDPASVKPSEERILETTAADRENLVVRVLSDVLYLFDAEHFVPRRMKVTSETPTAAQGVLLGEPLQTTHRLRLDVKAVTYHQLLVEYSPGSVRIRVFLDI